MALLEKKLLRWGQKLERSPTMRGLFKKMGCYIVREEPQDNTFLYIQRFIKMLEHKEITIIFDIGAHKGESAMQWRKFGYQRSIVSIEPVSTQFAALQKRCEQDPLWKCENCALGEASDTRALHVLQTSSASSFLEPNQLHAQANPKLERVREEQVSVKRLDEIVPHYCTPQDTICLKIDTQGYEKRIMEGAKGCLDQVAMIKLEATLVPIYHNQTTLVEMVAFMKSLGFFAASIEPGSVVALTGQHIEVDLIFWRSPQ